MKKLLEHPGEAYDAWNSSLPGYVAPHARIGSPFTTTDELRAAVGGVIELREQLRAEMIARQEEMDWLVYAAYGLIPDAGPALPDTDLVLAREQRPFCLWAGAEGDFEQAVDLIPPDWSAVRQERWRTRLETIRDNEHVRRIEQPVYKRRWDEQWKIGNSWQCGQPAYDAEFIDAFDWWLSEKAEWWLEHRKEGGSVTLEEWTAALWADERVQAAWPVAAEALHRLEQWKQQQGDKPHGKPPVLNVTRAAFGSYFKTLVKGQTVPDNIPFAEPWEKLEKKLKVPKAVKDIRGKLNVPRERFWMTPEKQFRIARPL
jgi:hypothetical protein